MSDEIPEIDASILEIPEEVDLDSSTVDTVAVSPYGTVIFSGSDDGTVRAIDADDGTEIWSKTCDFDGASEADEVQLEERPIDDPFRPLEEIVDEIERLAVGGWSIEDSARLEALLWALGEVDDDELSGAVDNSRLRDLTGSEWVGDPADLSRLRTEVDR